MISTARQSLWTAAAVAAGLLVAVAFALSAVRANGALGFPLDDAWIHLNYARTLCEHGVFAYFAGGPPTAGSTAPLFTLIEAVGFFVTSHEKPLAIVLGLAGQLAFLWAFARWARLRLGDPRWAALAVALVALDGRIALLSVSGMETSLFLALMALAIESRLAGRTGPAGLALGAALWVRPDALILAAVVAIDALFAGRERARRAPYEGAERRRDFWRRDALLLFGLFAGIALAYGAFNFAIGGRALPATFAAKTAFYGGRSRSGFVTGDVAECFGSGAWLVLAPFALFAVAREFRAFVRGRGSKLRLEAGWTIGLPLAYLVLLPYSHRFTRYLVPALPAYAVLAVAGLRAAAGSRWAARVPAGARRLTLALVLLAAGALHVRLALDSAEFYRYACRYHAERHERAGHWLAQHTPPDAVVGTHDVGAIAFYSRRRIVDAVGLVSPEVTPWIGKPWYTDSLAALFDRRGVTHVAAFDEWLPVDNVSPLVVLNDEDEVMRIFPWRPGRARILSREVVQLLGTAQTALRAGDSTGALAALQEAMSHDRSSSRAWALLGDVMARSGHAERATHAWQVARSLYPDSPEIAARLSSTRPDSASAR